MSAIIILCKTLLKGGAEKQALILSRSLTEENKDIILITWCGDKIDPSHLEFMRNNFIRHIELKGNPIKKWIDLQRVIKKEKVTIILSYLSLANFIAGLSKLFKRNLITIGGVRSEKLAFIKFIFERFTHNHLNDATVFNNYSAKKKFGKRGFNPDKIKVIHNAIRNLPSDQRTGNDNVVNIVSVSRFVKLKDYRTALSSFKEVRDKNTLKKTKYYIVGFGPQEEEIRTLIKKFELNDDVSVLINPPDIPGILKNCDIFLSTSLQEGLSNSIMEAMVAGLPVVATNVGDNPYLIKNAYNGFIVPPKNVKIIASKLEFLSDFEDIRREFGKNSKKIIEEEFSEKKLLENYLELFSDLSNTKT